MTNTLQPLPNPFLNSQASPRARRPSRFAAQPALVAFLICLVLGLATVVWRARTRANDARARAGLEALARGSAVELQLSQVVSAAEVLGALARQHGGMIPDFQKVGADLLAARPGLASLELQPGGIVSDIVPRAANARFIGFNVLNNPAYRPGASVAIQRRALTVSGPLALYGGAPGIVARVPVFQRGRDGRDAFWGFAAASMRITEALDRAHADDLAKHGYNYAFLAPASGREKGVTIEARGAVSAQSAMQQPVRVHNLEFRLLLQPRGGWMNKTKLALELLGVFAVAGLICLLVNLLESRRSLEAALADTNQRLTRETEDRKRAQEDCRGAKDEGAAAHAELSRTRSVLQSSTELEVRLNASVRAAEAAAQATQAELDQARMALQQAEQTIASLQSRLRAAARARKESGAAPPTLPQPAPPSVADVPARVDAPALAPEQSTESSPASLSQVEETRQELSAPPDVNDAAPSSSEPAPDPRPTPTPTPERELPALPAPLEAPAPAAALPSEPLTEKKPTRAPRRKKARPDNQMDFFAAQPAAEPVPATPPASPLAEEPVVEAPSLPPSTASAADAPDSTLADPKPRESKPARPLPARPPLDLAQLRKAVNLILPLFTGRDPGARDCLKDNRTTFRSAFAPEAYLEFEQSVKNADFDAALEHLKKAAKRCGIPV
jgi:sensor domain CHASE-containing protein